MIDALTFDRDRVLWDAEYRRAVIARLKQLDQAKEKSEVPTEPPQIPPQHPPVRRAA